MHANRDITEMLQKLILVCFNIGVLPLICQITKFKPSPKFSTIWYGKTVRSLGLSMCDGDTNCQQMCTRKPTITWNAQDESNLISTGCIDTDC